MIRRNLLTLIVLLGAAVFGVIYFWPRHAHGGAIVSIGGRTAIGNVDIRGRLHLGDRAIFRRQLGIGARERFGRGPHRRFGNGPRHRPDRFHRPPVFVVPVEPAARPPVIIRQTVVEPPPPPETPAAAAAAEPLDPRGSARIVGARGGAAPTEWVLGETLPADRPHVTLDPATYGLPEPPAGQIYARVGRDVLRIDAQTRRIVAVVAD